MRSTLRSRLTLALVGVATGVLLVASGLTWLGVRGSAQRSATNELRDQAERLHELTADLRAALDQRSAIGQQTPATTRGRNAELLRQFIQIARGAQVSNARLVWVEPSGEILEGEDLDRIVGQIERREPDLASLLALPDELAETDLDGAALWTEGNIEGTEGSFAYRADLLTGNGESSARALAVVLTREIDTATQRRVATTFVLAAAVALALSVAVSAWLARRIAGRIAAIANTAAAIAGGDLAARVPADSDGEAELAVLAATINRMASDLEAARGADRSFLMSVSHDLRTPLTSIRGYAEALGDGTLDQADPAARRRAAEVIAAEARRLERLVQDLLDLGRLDRREFSLHPTRCDAAAVVADAAMAFAPKAAELGVELGVVRGEPIPADLDAERLAQIVANLVENALKYASSTVTVSVHALDAALEVRVEDDGPGIPPEQRTAVFGRLHTVRSTPGRSVGTGLGLAIVHELAAAMGGSAAVEATDPNAPGTTFTVRVRR